MGNHNTRAIGFRQSLQDFPCSVKLGNKTPSFGVNRFNKVLRFIPSDDEGFTLRGDKQRLLYKGRRRSHRFTILGDTAFEYDCILEKPPENNVITLRMEGAENFDFFRQPDFLTDPLLAGSYAVYKNETLLGEGTGKLCHIYRPEIIDARGRRCWGGLSVIGNELRITIPEWWLSEAKYPVIVDPTIGTATVGSQYKHVWEQGEPAEPLMFELAIPVNRFLVLETINGQCIAFAYVNSDDGEAGGRPVIYSDNGNSPLTKKSMQENLFDFRVNGSKPAGWRSTTFSSNGSIASGVYIWFGIFAEYYWMARFDYGASCYADLWDAYSSIPNAYPISKWTEIYNFKLSMYFTYTSGQNYLRTLTQGVTLNDSRKLQAEYKRKTTHTVQANMNVNYLKIILLFFQEAVKNNDTLSYISAYFRRLSDTAETDGKVHGGWIITRKITDTVHAAGIVFRGLILFVRIITGVFVRDYLLGRFLKAREELILKSAVSREIELESNIQ